ncbi:MAG: NAD-dependent epimerase/dehydratase family protein [Saprospiraceae bacterium]|nr:NAD-dependent epimerase/dehydratase family protein [Saprospiraceae bacterium]
MENLSKPILITGATGFVGSYLTRYLVKKGYTNLICMKRASSRMDLVADITDRVKWEEGDVRDMPFLEDILRGYAVKQIFHCAGVVSYDARDREEMYDINAAGTANIVNAALANDIEKLIHVSSIAAIGRVENQNTISENSKWQRSDLNTHYAISKYQAEQEVWRGIAEGLSAAIVNPSVILGAQFWEHGTGKLFQQVWTGLRFYTEGATGYVDVRDVVQFMEKLMVSDIESQRFILNGENWTYKMMFENIADALQKRRATIPVTPFIRQVAWRVEWLRSLVTKKRPLITKETARTSATTFFFKNEKSLAAFLDFKYTPITQIIEETAQQFLASKKIGKQVGILPISVF